MLGCGDDDTDSCICLRPQYDEANKEVAILCNHQKGVSKNHDTAMAKLVEKKEALKSELKDASGAAAGRIKCARSVCFESWRTALTRLVQGAYCHS